MQEIASVNRYCSIEGIECNKQIPFIGRDSFFFAYPSTEKWRDFSLHLTGELGQSGIKVERWEDVIRNDLLFSKVCEGIYGHDYLLAEVTEPNPNVLLEVGYALAVGRLPILLRDTNVIPWNRTLLTTLESCFYDTRTSIHQYILNLLSGERSVPEHPDRRLPYLEQMGIFNDAEIPNTVFHLKPKLTTDWISKIDRTLGSGFFKLSKMDPSDSVYDEFYPHAREIQRASLVIASLVSKQNQNWEEHNANVALLIGFAIGLGKRVLVLQQEPKTPILDLGSLFRPFDSESQAVQIVQGWIDLQRKASESEIIASRNRARVQRQINQIRNLYLGHPDALQDTGLLDYFVPTKEYEDAVAGRRSIFIGRRGSGKSANFQAIKDSLKEKSNTITVEIAPDDFELEQISEFLDSGQVLANPKLVYQNTWNYILITEMLKSLAEQSDHLYAPRNDQDSNNLYQYYDDNRALLELDFGARVISTLGSFTASLIPGKSFLSFQSPIDSLRDYNINRRLRDLAKRENATFFIVVDDLDKHWRSDSRPSIDLLLGLIAEAYKLQLFFEGNLQVALFLREDIFDVLSLYDEDLPKRDYLRMDWTTQNLKHLVAERLSVGIDLENDDDDLIWSMIFPYQVNESSSANYILSHCLPRPMDVLGLCQAAIDQAQRNGHSEVHEQDILDGEALFADNFIRSIAAEFKGLYPALEEVLLEFAGVPSVMQWEQFRRYATVAIAKNQPDFLGWAEGSQTDELSMADVLFQIGVIGLAAEHRHRPHYRNGRTFRETWRLVSPSPLVHIHPAFHRVLDVTHAGTRGPISRRALKPTDPRQLTLGDLP